MSRFPRFHKTGRGSFFGDFVYDRVVKKDHFLVALQELFDWEGLCGDLIKLYKGKGLRGRPPYKPELTFTDTDLHVQDALPVLPLQRVRTPDGAVGYLSPGGEMVSGISSGRTRSRSFNLDQVQGPSYLLR